MARWIFRVPGFRSVFASFLLGFYPFFTRFLLGFYQPFTRFLLGFYQLFAWFLPGFCSKITRFFPLDFPVFVCYDYTGHFIGRSPGLFTRP